VQRRSSFTTPVRCWAAIAAVVAGAALSACASTSSPQPPKANAQSLLGMSDAAPLASDVGERELSPDEKKIIVDAVALSIRDPGSAKYHWAKIPATAEGSVNYCATVDAKSPYPAYNGRQAYIVEAQVSGGKLSSAVVGLIAGGKDVAIVAKMCEKYGLNPNKAS
jgi:hypothetical protein